MNTKLNLFFAMRALVVFLISVQLFPLHAQENVLPAWAMGGFERPDGVNPLISPTSSTSFMCPMKGTYVNWECADTFNPAAVVKDGKICILYRAEDDPDAALGMRTSRIGYALASDGVHIDYRSNTPVAYPDSSRMSQIYEWPGGVEDPRVVFTTDYYSIFYR